MVRKEKEENKKLKNMLGRKNNKNTLKEKENIMM